MLTVPIEQNNHPGVCVSSGICNCTEGMRNGTGVSDLQAHAPAGWTITGQFKLIVDAAAPREASLGHVAGPHDARAPQVCLAWTCRSSDAGGGAPGGGALLQVAAAA